MTAALTTGLACPPLFGTPRRPERATLGPHVGAVAARFGKPLMPHQQHIADVALEVDEETGLLAYSAVTVVMMRQNGKTELLLPVMTHRCVADWRRPGSDPRHAPEPQRVLYTAQTADDARKKWRDVHLPRILAARQVRRHLVRPSAEWGGARLRLNAEAILWKNGSIWSPGSTTGKTSGTGDTLDLAMIDEAWSHQDGRIEVGMRPTMLTRWDLSPQLWRVSMIPGPSRAAPGTWRYLANLIRVGRAQVEAGVSTGTATFYFGAQPGMDPRDPATWWSSMPALGHTITEASVAAAANDETMDLADFEAEYLSIEPAAATPRWTLVGRDTWDGLRDPDSQIAGPVALGAEVNEERTRGWIGAAGLRDDGHVHVEVVEPGWRVPPHVVGVDWMLPRLAELCSRRSEDLSRVATVVVDKRRPANSLVVPLRRLGVDVLTPSAADIAGGCGRFYDRTGQEADDGGDDGVRLRHLGQEEIAQALAGARKLDLGEGAFTFVRKGSVSDLGGLYCVVLAMIGADVKGSRRVKPRIWG